MKERPRVPRSPGIPGLFCEPLKGFRGLPGPEGLQEPWENVPGSPRARGASETLKKCIFQGAQSEPLTGSRVSQGPTGFRNRGKRFVQGAQREPWKGFQGLETRWENVFSKGRKGNPSSVPGSPRARVASGTMGKCIFQGAQREPLRGSTVSQGPTGFRNPGKMYFPRGGLPGPDGLQEPWENVFVRGKTHLTQKSQGAQSEPLTGSRVSQGPMGFRNPGNTYLRKGKMHLTQCQGVERVPRSSRTREGFRNPEKPEGTQGC